MINFIPFFYSCLHFRRNRMNWWLVMVMAEVLRRSTYVPRHHKITTQTKQAIFHSKYISQSLFLFYLRQVIIPPATRIFGALSFYPCQYFELKQIIWNLYTKSETIKGRPHFISDWPRFPVWSYAPVYGPLFVKC